MHEQHVLRFCVARGLGRGASPKNTHRCQSSGNCASWGMSRLNYGRTFSNAAHASKNLIMWHSAHFSSQRVAATVHVGNKNDGGMSSAPHLLDWRCNDQSESA